MVKSADPLRWEENVLDSMWIPAIATLGRVRWPLRRFCLRAFGGREHDEAAQADVDGLTGGDAFRRGELCPVDPGPAHAPKIAQPIRALLEGDSRVLAGHRKIGQLDRALRTATDCRPLLRYVEGRRGGAFALESEGEAVRRRLIEVGNRFPL